MLLLKINKTTTIQDIKVLYLINKIIINNYFEFGIMYLFKTMKSHTKFSHFLEGIQI